MKILYLDCISGISGDMTLGSLCDLGVNPKLIEQELDKLSINNEYTLKWNKVVKKGISAVKFDVQIINEHTNEHHHHHKHRHYSDIKKMIESSPLNDNVKKISLGIFENIGKAEAKIHNIELEKVHFHEVGAVDSIVDIVGIAVAIDSLKVDKIYSSSVPVGNGRIKIDHGIYPVPAPATLELLKNVPIKSTDITGELTTPTGAGILATIVDKFTTFPSIEVTHIGYGAGTKDFEQHPNVLRTIIGNCYNNSKGDF